MPRVLILHHDPENKVISCYNRNKLDFFLIRVHNLKGTPIVGQFLQYTNDGYLDEKLVLNVKHGSVEDAKTEDYISREEDGNVLMSSWIGFSNDPTHKTFDRSLAFADWYGLLDSSKIDFTRKKANIFGSLLKIKDDIHCNRESWSQPFEIFLVKGPITSWKKKEEAEKFTKKIKKFEESLKNAYQIDELGMQMPNVVNIQNAVSCMSLDSSRSSECGRNSNGNPKAIGTEVLPTQKLGSESSISTNAMAVIRENCRIIVYLFDKKLTAALWNENPDSSSIRLGTVFQCTYKSIKAHGNIEFEVAKVLKINEKNRVQIRNIGKLRYKMRMTVDFYSPIQKFGEWYKCDGAPIMQTSDGTYVILDTMVRDGDGYDRDCHETSRVFGKNARYRWMYCICGLVKQQVPRMMVDEKYEGVETVTCYAWKLFEIEGAVDLIDRDEKLTFRDENAVSSNEMMNHHEQLR